MHTINKCGISEADDFHVLWKLPSLPLTERFGSFKSKSFLTFDQELVISLPTGHVQLNRQLNPHILYSASVYSFRTADSCKSKGSVQFFLDFLKNFSTGHRFSSAVDVGGNDLSVARYLIRIAEHCSVIDPICSEMDGKVIDGIKVFGRFVEQVDMSSDLPRPDLVICRHTLEHIAQPREVLRQWFKQCDPECLYLVEIPCFENLVEAMRFDAIFHQHFHYFDLASFKHLLWECGGEYLDHSINYQGPCGGALLVAFKQAKVQQPRPKIDIEARIRRIENRIKRYQEQMVIMGELLSDLPKPVYGYGASLMLATLGYHLNTDFSSLECVLDDNPLRDGTTYENVPVTVRHTTKVCVPPNSSYIITSLENVRPIYRRILELAPRRILVPLIS